MADRFQRIEAKHAAFIDRQRIFFTGSAAAAGRVNVSPKDAASFRILDPARVAWLDVTGSGNETAAHLQASRRLTVMFCAFEGPPLILRLYGHGRILAPGSADYASLLPLFAVRPGTRQIVLLEVELVQTSCGYGVPRFDYQGERPNLDRWAEAKGEEGLEDYRRTHNTRSLDGLTTGLLEAETANVEG